MLSLETTEKEFEHDVSFDVWAKDSTRRGPEVRKRRLDCPLVLKAAWKGVTSLNCWNENSPFVGPCWWLFNKCLFSPLFLSSSLVDMMLSGGYRFLVNANGRCHYEEGRK